MHKKQEQSRYGVLLLLCNCCIISEGCIPKGCIPKSYILKSGIAEVLLFAILLNCLQSVIQIQHQVVDILLCRIHVFIETGGRAEDEASALLAVSHALIDQAAHLIRRGEQQILDLDIAFPADTVAVFGNDLAHVDVTVLGGLQGI